MNENSSTPILDRSVKATGDDAMMAKLATTRAGYYVDPFLESFCQISAGDSYTPMERSPAKFGVRMGHTRNHRRRTVQPIIKRGTHARVCVVDRAISVFFEMKHEACQVVVLGAGKDTTYFRYRNGDLTSTEERKDNKNIEEKYAKYRQRRVTEHQHLHGTSSPKVHWYEVDHVSVIEEKASSIRKSDLLKSFCPLLIKTERGYEYGDASSSLRTFSSRSSSSTYHLVGYDLRESPSILMGKLNLNPSLPTLFVMECVSMYLPIRESKILLQALSLSADTVYIACYEPILGSNSSERKDPFGQVMEKNLIKRGVASPDSCLLQTRTLELHLEKLLECEGFVRVVGCDMWSAYETIVTATQRKRANQSEFMDEYEEWMLIMRHYCFTVAEGGRSLGRQSPSKLTTVLDQNGNEETLQYLGWISRKCIQQEKSPE